ncbi:MAG TPA: PASTA domain-containing protein [Acidimicrobiales bacterium]|nr:PASTA domain-containing protein [Acidimicrobiales bacterium]
MAPQRVDDLVGRALGGRYRLLSVLGAGASAVVYLAEDGALGRPVAVKVLHAGLAADEGFLRRFRAEARAAAGLRHPHIVAVFDWGEDDGLVYLVLEHMGGGSLRDILDAGRRLSPAQAASAGSQAARALAHAHARGLAHRDIKPANLLFDEDGRLAVADFGVARALAEATWTEPAGVLLGTARYASPEQAQGNPTDGRTDVYSLALSLFEAVTGRPPFAGETTVSTLMARLGRRVEAGPELGPLGPAIEAASEPDPNRRPDAEWLARSLEAVVARFPQPRPIPLAPPGSAARAADEVTIIGGPGDDTTELGVSAPPLPPIFVPEPDVGASPPPTAAIPVAEAPTTAIAARPDGGAAAELVAPEVPPGGSAPESSPRRRRVPRLALLVVGLLAALAVAAWLLLGVLKVTTPSHRLVDLQDATLARARSLLTADHFKVRVGPAQYSDGVPAGEVMSQQPRPGTSLKEGSTVTLVLSRGPAPRAVPNLRGMSQSAAEAALQRAGFDYQVLSQYDESVPAGHVIDWNPQGTQPKGTLVTLTVSEGHAPRTVPDLTGDSYAAAAAQLQSLGLVPQRQDVFSSTVAPDQVVTTDPGPGQSAPYGSAVTVEVSKGPDLVPVPAAIIGKSVDQATAILAADGLQVANVFGPPNAKVFYVDPPQGTPVPRGSSVDLYTKP